MKLQPGVHVYEKRVQNELCMGYINIMAGETKKILLVQIILQP